MNLIMAIFMITAILRNCLLYMNQDITLWCTIDVVGSEYATIFSNSYSVGLAI